MKRIIDLLKRKGFMETFHVGLIYILSRLLSYVKVQYLCLRGYNIHYSVGLAGSCRFFQGAKQAIRIEKDCEISQNVSVMAGFGGTISIRRRVCINPYTTIDIQSHLEIGENTLIAPGCYICDYDHNFENLDKPINKQGYVSQPITIGSDVWIGAKSIILKGVHIGRGVVIGAGSVVTCDIPDFSIAAGNPARVIKKRIRR